MKAILYCHECGQKILDGENFFCDNCGANLQISTKVEKPPVYTKLSSRLKQQESGSSNNAEKRIKRKLFVYLGLTMMLIGAISGLIGYFLIIFGDVMGLLYGILIIVFGSTFPIFFGYILFLKGLDKIYQGIVLMVTGVISTVILLLVIFFPSNYDSFTISARIILDAVGEILIYTVFITLGAYDYSINDKQKDIFTGFSWLYLTIRSVIPIFLLLPSNWIFLRVEFVFSFSVFWFLAFVVNRLTVKYSEKKYMELLQNLNIFAMLIYVSFFLTTIVMYIASSSTSLSYSQFYYSNYTDCLGIGFLIAFVLMIITLLARYAGVYFIF